MVATHRKGSRWRLEVQHWLNGWGWATRFRSIGEPGDDITAKRPGLELSVEAKNCKRIDLSTFVDQAVGNAGSDQIPIVVIKRRGKTSVDDAYIVMPGWAFQQLLEERQVRAVERELPEIDEFYRRLQEG